MLAGSALRFHQLQASQQHTCGVAGDGEVYCWGVNRYFELGSPTAPDLCDIPALELVGCTHRPQRVAAAPALVRLVTSGGLYGRTCGLSADGSAYCWGFGQGGQLGNGGRADSAVPVPVAGALRFATLRSAFALASCGATAGDDVWCWGVNDRGLWGNGEDSGQSSIPQRVDWGRRFVDFDLGADHGCGVDEAGQAWCWGANWYGNLGIGAAGGDGGPFSVNTPRAVLGGHRFKTVSTGLNHSCALTDAGAAWCWGAASVATAVGGIGYVGTPQPVPGNHVFAELRSGALHACALKADGTAWCWGENYLGELGDGTTAPSTVPVQVQTGARFARLSHRPTCALTADGQAWCWGDNSYGQVGLRSIYAR